MSVQINLREHNEKRSFQAPASSIGNDPLVLSSFQECTAHGSKREKTNGTSLKVYTHDIQSLLWSSIGSNSWMRDQVNSEREEREGRKRGRGLKPSEACAKQKAEAV